MSSGEISEVTQYLTFNLGDEEFALEIAQVREVLDYTTITKVPRMPEFLRGVINLRGNVVPVIDLRLKLGMSAAKNTVDTCIVIVEIEIEGELIQVGALADSVQEVIDLDPSQIAPPPRIGTKLDTKFNRGMGKRGETFLIILDIDQVFSSEDIEVVKSTARESVEESEEAGLEECAPHVSEPPTLETEALESTA